MAKGLAAGMTDYAHQSFKDILADLIEERGHVETTIQILEHGMSVSKETGYWTKVVPQPVRAQLAYVLKFCQTTIEEFDDIIIGVQQEVEAHHINRLKDIAKTASAADKSIGVAWHQQYDNQDFGNPDFQVIEQMYCDARDAVVNLFDINNLAERLQVFVGKKATVVPKNDVKKILFLSASPDDAERLRVDIEGRRIDERLQASKFREKIVMIKKEAVKVETITKALFDNAPQLVHFTGHGDEDATGIVVENEYGESMIWPTSGVKRAFALFKDGIEAVILNSCKSENTAKAISETGIYVIGMRGSVDEDGSIDFSIGFYQAVGEGKNVEFAFQLGLALLSAHTEYAASLPTLWKDGVQVVFE